MKQILKSTSLDQYLEIKQLLESHNIEFKEKVNSAENVIDFISKLMVHSHASLGTRNEHDQVYEIYVEDEEYEHAKELVGCL